MIDEQNMKKLKELGNEEIIQTVEKYVELCKPSKVTVITDSDEDISYIRNSSLEKGEEKKLTIEGHTIHFDGMSDQGRDKAHTCVLLPEGKEIGKHINTTPKEEGLKEIFGFMGGIMEGKEMFVRFFCLGPKNSKFSILALQISDSAYVCHSEDILYRTGYEQFKKDSSHYFTFLHSAGELDEKGNTKNIDQRRIYINLEEEEVYSINNQYAGNSLGLKKLALRLAISKSNKEDWLTEHMFIMGVQPVGKNRKTYFTGAYPSACGKTSTAMISGQTIIGDDIAYIKVWEDGTCHAANVEQGVFGIITDVNAKDDALIYKCLTTPRELIFSNILINEGNPYWINMGIDIPSTGINYSGEWSEGKTDETGKPLSFAHKNARYTMRINELENADEKADTPDGVQVDGILYGGRDSDTNVPICQSLSWSHGVFIGASIESETTAATLGVEGQRAHSPMANLDFLVVPLGTYIENHLKFAERLDKVPLIFSTNYFLKTEEGKFLNEKTDKKIWLLWAEGRVHNEYGAIETPIGYIPIYQDLADLFKQVFNVEYTKNQYVEQFALRVDNLVAKLDRMEEIYKDDNVPAEFLNHISQQKERLTKAKEEKGEIISPFDF